jgi:hypothetical protein
VQNDSEDSGIAVHRRKPRRFYFKLSKKIRVSKKPSWFNNLFKKTKKVLFQSFKKNKSLQKPSWFNIRLAVILHAKKTKKVLFQTFKKKIRASQKTFLA